jgi:hypothetical protein
MKHQQKLNSQKQYNEESDMSEKRIFNRSPIELAASFGIQNDEIAVKTKDISGGGLCIVSSKKLKVDEVIEMDIEISADEHIAINAKVCWCKADDNSTYQVGVSVEENTSPDFDRFYSFYCTQTK